MIRIQQPNLYSAVECRLWRLSKARQMELTELESVDAMNGHVHSGTVLDRVPSIEDPF